jgi:hypothetical protein
MRCLGTSDEGDRKILNGKSQTCPVVNEHNNNANILQYFDVNYLHGIYKALAVFQRKDPSKLVAGPRRL